MIIYGADISGSLTVTGSVNIGGALTAASVTGSFSGVATTASFAQTASSADSFTIRQSATASNMLLTGTLVAQTINVQQVTSSIVYSSGSNRFGNLLTDVQQMTGSLRVTGSGDHYFLGGNLGLGVTPSAHGTPAKVIEVNNGTAFFGYNDGTNIIGGIGQNYYGIGTTPKYLNNARAAAFAITNGGFEWSTAPPGTAGNTVTFTTAMTLNTSGSLGLGVTPSAWDTLTALQIKNAAFAGYTTGTTHVAYVGSNFYYGGGDKYIANGYASLYTQASGNHNWYNAPNNTSGAGAALTFTQSMTLDSSGNLGIGTPTPQRKIDVVASTDNITAASFGRGLDIGEWSGVGFGYVEANNSNYRKTALVFERTGGAAEGKIHILNNNSADISSATLADARLTILPDGNVGINTISPTAKLSVAGSGSFTAGVRIGTDSTNNLIDDASNGAGSTTLYIGNLSINAGPSDVRLKKNIVNTSIAGVDTINKLRVVDFNWQDPSDKSWNNRNARGTWTGLIAQETIKHVPYVVNAPRDRETMQPVEDSQEAYWQIEYQHLVPVLIKAVQELKAENEAFKVEINSLKAEITQLKSN